MDLIYANENKEDIGVLQYYKLDMAYGSSENNFELQLNLSEHCMDYGYYIYAENTEYGGIVDTIIVDNGNQIVKYQGRTWHGILAKSVILPDGDYITVTGEANQILADLIERQGLNDIFDVSLEDSGIEIAEYSFRYIDVYSGILNMLREYQGKLSMNWQDGKILLSCQLAIDFTNNDDWDSSQLEFEISQNNRPVNHLICLGQGNMSDRAVIHLFTDEDGNIQEYASENPMEDSDYITDTSNIVLTGINEVAEVYDYSSAEILINYIPLSEQPSDWISNHTAYYNKDDNGEFKSLEVTQQEQYSLIATEPADWSTSFGKYYALDGGDYKKLESITTTMYNILLERPSDWSTNYSNYFQKDGDTYNSIEPVTNYTYKILSKKPNDWQNNYSNYYTFDGRRYNSVSGASKTVYYVQIGKPSGWDDNYASSHWKAPKYSIKASNNKKGYEIYISGSEWQTADKIYVVDKDKINAWKKATKSQRKKININKLVNYIDEYKKIPKWRKDTYYNQGSITVSPEWKSNYYYVQNSSLSAPTYTPATYYQKVISVTPPTFIANTYYSMSIVDVYNNFSANNYYRSAEDRYKALVESGIVKLNEYYAERNTVDVDLQETQEYDINDIVGATENTTGISVKQYIIKKIIKIEDGNIMVNYTIGKE